LTAHFGLGQNAQAESVEIRWPSGQVDVLHNVPANQFIVVEESKAVKPQGKFATTWGEVKCNRLYQNYPNPFNPETWIPYQLAEPVDVVLCIYNQSGQLVRTLRLGHKETGIYLEKSHAGYWNGRNEAGEPVASGIYFYRLEAGDFCQTRRMTVLK